MQSLTTLGSSITKDDAPYVEELLRKVFAVLRSDKGINPVDLIDSYQIALRGLDKNGLRQTVLKILSGTLDAKLRFVPLPPELANYVRLETRTIFNLSRPTSTTPAESTPMLDKMQKRWADVPCLFKNIDHDKAFNMAKKGEVPVGAVYVEILQSFYMPPPGFYGSKKVRPDHGQAVTPEMPSDIANKDPAYLQQLLMVKDANTLTAEQEDNRIAAERAVAAYQARNEVENDG